MSGTWDTATQDEVARALEIWNDTRGTHSSLEGMEELLNDFLRRRAEARRLRPQSGER